MRAFLKSLRISWQEFAMFWDEIIFNLESLQPIINFRHFYVLQPGIMICIFMVAYNTSLMTQISFSMLIFSKSYNKLKAKTFDTW